MSSNNINLERIAIASLIPVLPDVSQQVVRSLPDTTFRLFTCQKMIEFFKTGESIASLGITEIANKSGLSAVEYLELESIDTSNGAWKYHINNLLMERFRETDDIAFNEAITAISRITSNDDYSPVKTALESFPLIPFPIDVLPPDFNNLTKKYADALQCEQPFMAMAMLTVLSGAIGNSVEVSVKNKWSYSPFLWLSIIDLSGAGKSHVIKAAMQPLIKKQAVEFKRYEKELAEYNNDLMTFKKDKKSIVTPIEPEPMRHYYTSDFTIESLIPLFKRTARGLVSYQDELAGQLKSLNQYKGGKGNDEEQFLKLFDGGDLKTDRASKNSFCRESGLAVIGGIQPNVFKSVFQHEKNIDNGMIFRWLPMVINSPPQLFSFKDISESDIQEYSNLVDWSLNMIADTNEAGFIMKTRLILNHDAHAAWVSFHDNLQKTYSFMPDRFKGYLKKAITYSIKFIGLLHLLHCYEIDKTKRYTVVSKSVVDGAIQLTNYFLGQALQLCLDSKETESEPYQLAMLQAIELLKDSGKTGNVLLSDVRIAINTFLPERMQFENNNKQNQNVARILKKIGINTISGTGHRTFAVII